MRHHHHNNKPLSSSGGGGGRRLLAIATTVQVSLLVLFVFYQASVLQLIQHRSGCVTDTDTGASTSVVGVPEPPTRANRREAAPPVTATPTTLWLVTCETRGNDNEDLASWKMSAEAVRQRFQQERPSPSGRHRVVRRVEVRNVCKGKAFRWGLMTKFRYMLEFLDGFPSLNATTTTEKEEDLVMFTDSDSIFNVWGVPVPEVVERYDAARRGRPILISGEPNCWMEGFCDAQTMLALFPDQVATRSSCPRFLNAGMYVGPALALRTMVHQILNDPRVSELAQALGIKPNNDQARMAVWNRLYGRDQDKAVLDDHALLFRNTFFGRVDATKEGVWSCGGGGIGTKIGPQSCGTFQPARSGAVNPDDGTIEFQSVPGCLPSSTFRQEQQNGSSLGFYESIPFVVHGNGGGGNKLAVRRMATELNATLVRGNNPMGQQSPLYSKQ